jgi:acyl-CoA synthetase (AMP-forming)/AMP-acid ligase II
MGRPQAEGGVPRSRTTAAWKLRPPNTCIDDGIVRIVDRAKDMINRGGENVYSVEVENALCAHPDVIEVAVVGVPDPLMGGAEALVPSLIAYAREQLADFKVPQFVRVLEGPLPRNAGGKVLKAPLRATEEWIAVPG